jgi:hypothetical protein
LGTTYTPKKLVFRQTGGRRVVLATENSIYKTKYLRNTGRFKKLSVVQFYSRTKNEMSLKSCYQYIQASHSMESTFVVNL